MPPLALYSTNTLLAYRFNQRYYGELHYVWSSPYFSAKSAPPLDVQTPPSSTPDDIFKSFRDAIDREDAHSDGIRRNIAGLRRGMSSKLAAGVIGEEQYRELEQMLAAAKFSEFRPLLYVIPYQGVADLVKNVPFADKAAPFALEYIIESLPRSRFDVLEL